MTAKEPEEKSTIYCSFCGKSQHEVRKLIAGPTVFICEECVSLCADILREYGFDIVPPSYTPEKRTAMLRQPVTSINDILRLGGISPIDQLTLKGEDLLCAVAYGLYQATQPDGKERLRQYEMEDLKRQMREAIAPVREVLMPLRARRRELARKAPSD